MKTILAVIVSPLITLIVVTTGIMIGSENQPVHHYYGVDTPYSDKITYLYDIPFEGGIQEKIPLGIYNKNAGNIKISSSEWQGQVGENMGFVVFETHAHGVRAIAKLLQTYELRHGLNTVDGIIRRYSATQQEKYIEFMCYYLDVHPHQQLNMEEILPQFVKGIIYFENGMMPYTEEVFILLGV